MYLKAFAPWLISQYLLQLHRITITRPSSLSNLLISRQIQRYTAPPPRSIPLLTVGEIPRLGKLGFILEPPSQIVYRDNLSLLRSSATET